MCAAVRLFPFGCKLFPSYVATDNYSRGSYRLWFFPHFPTPVLLNMHVCIRLDVARKLCNYAKQRPCWPRLTTSHVFLMVIKKSTQNDHSMPLAAKGRCRQALARQSKLATTLQVLANVLWKGEGYASQILKNTNIPTPSKYFRLEVKAVKSIWNALSM